MTTSRNIRMDGIVEDLGCDSLRIIRIFNREGIGILALTVGDFLQIDPQRVLAMRGLRFGDIVLLMLWLRDHGVQDCDMRAYVDYISRKARQMSGAAAGRSCAVQ